jgi:sec-independent protein translocase protein TatA
MIEFNIYLVTNHHIVYMILSIGGSEWVILIILFFILVIGSKHLPGLGRALGRVHGEYERARASVRRELERVNINSNTSSHGLIPIEGPVGSEREKLERIAASLGIDTRGMSDDELRRLIMNRLRDR